jgi:hypothetical protein
MELLYLHHCCYFWFHNNINGVVPNDSGTAVLFSGPNKALIFFMSKLFDRKRKTIPFFLYLHHGKEHQIFGIRAIEAIQSGALLTKSIFKKASTNLKDDEGNEAEIYFFICSS